jgi:hypothetical protein
MMWCRLGIGQANNIRVAVSDELQLWGVEESYIECVGIRITLGIMMHGILVEEPG